jgi:hypothetical protein
MISLKVGLFRINPHGIDFSGAKRTLALEEEFPNGIFFI